MVLLPQSPLWRTVVTDLNTVAVTMLDKRASNRVITPVLNQPLTMTGSVPSDDPLVNTPYPTPGDDPYLAEGTRLMYMFRRDYGNAQLAPWTCRGAGIIQQIEDSARQDDARSTYTAFDPWKYWYSVPVLNSNGGLIGGDGISYTATTGDVIAQELIENALLTVGNMYLDLSPAYGGTGFWAGTVETTTPLTINFAQGISLGEALKQLVDTGTMDIVLNPIYDPTNRPGICVELNIYVQAGIDNTDAIFSWDKPGRSLTAISALYDGTQRANHVQFYTGVGNKPVTAEEDLASISKYGEYWAQQFWPGISWKNAVEALAAAQLDLRKNGQRTTHISPAPERAPQPFIQYNLGDRVPVYASKNFRQELAGVQRIYGFPLALSDDALETVTEALASPDGFTS